MGGEACDINPTVALLAGCLKMARCFNTVRVCVAKDPRKICIIHFGSYGTPEGDSTEPNDFVFNAYGDVVVTAYDTSDDGRFVPLDYDACVSTEALDTYMACEFDLTYCTKSRSWGARPIGD